MKNDRKQLNFFWLFIQLKIENDDSNTDLTDFF